MRRRYADPVRSLNGDVVRLTDAAIVSRSLVEGLPARGVERRRRRWRRIELFVFQGEQRSCGRLSFFVR